MRVFIVGGDSAIGNALKETLESRGDTVFFTTRRPTPAPGNALHLDLASSDVDRVGLPEADATFFCAAITGFAACRKDEVLARQVNLIAPSVLARRLVEAGSRVVFLSSNAVFDWSEPRVPANRKPCPVTKYGRLKAEAEKAFLDLGPAASILRISKVLRPEDRLFNGWISDLGQRKSVNAYADHRFAPVTLADTVGAILAISKSPDGGLFQMSGARDISYYQAALHLAALMGADPKLIVPTKAGESGVPLNEIIHNSTLDSSRITAFTGWTPPEPLSVIDDVFREQIAAAQAS